MNEYSNDIQIGFRWADAPAFRFENLSRDRALVAAHEVTATFDIVAQNKALTRDLPAQPILTFVWNLSLTLNALRRGAAHSLTLPVEGTASSLLLKRENQNLELTVTTSPRPAASATLALDAFIEMFRKRIRELWPTLERLPHSDTKQIFTERLQACELLLAHNIAPMNIPALTSAGLYFSTASTSQSGERIQTVLAPDPWEVRHRPPARWFGELSIASPARPKVTVAGMVLDYLQAVTDSTKTHDPGLVNADEVSDVNGVMASIAGSTDGRRTLLEHIAELARSLSRCPGGPSAPSLLRLARDAQDQASTLLSRVDISFEERRREIAQIVSEPLRRNESESTPALEPRPFSARNLRRLRLEREWALNLDEPGKLVHVGADSRRLLLAFQRSVTLIDLRDATATTALRAAPGSVLSYARSEEAVQIRSGGRLWSFHARHARLVSWPDALRLHASKWWRHRHEGTLVASDDRTGMLYRKRLLTNLEAYESSHDITPLATDRDSCLVKSLRGRIQLISLADGTPEWTAIADFDDIVCVALHDDFVVLVVSSDRGHKVIWLDRQTGIATWSSDIPSGDVQIHLTTLGPLVTSVSSAHGLHATRLDGRSGTPGLFGRFDIPGPVLDIRAEGEHLFVRTAHSVICTGLKGRLHEPEWVLTHERSIPPDQVRWAISDDVIAILGDHLTLVAVETGRTMFEVPAFWEELVFASIDDELHLVVVERRQGDEFTVHRLHCRGFLVPVD